jgi:hypothetical protein
MKKQLLDDPSGLTIQADTRIKGKGDKLAGEKMSVLRVITLLHSERYFRQTQHRR